MTVRYVEHHRPRSSTLPEVVTSIADLCRPEPSWNAEGFFAVHDIINADEITIGKCLGTESPHPGPATVVSLDVSSPLHPSLRVGDVIISINGRVADSAALASALLCGARGAVTMFVVRSLATSVRHISARRGEGGSFGVNIATDPEVGMCPYVNSFAPSSSLASAGLRVGDSVMAVDGRPCLSAEDATHLLKQTPAGSEVHPSPPARITRRDSAVHTRFCLP